MRTSAPAGRPSLLFLCHTLPYPPDSGANIRSYNILRLLEREFTVTALCFFRRAGHSSPGAVSESVRHLSRFARVEAFPIPQEHSRLRLFTDHGQSLARCQAYTLWVYASRDYRARISGLLGTGEVDLVHVDSLDLVGYLQLLSGIPTVCTHHNVESQLLRRRALAEPSRWRRKYLLRQAGWVEELERTGFGGRYFPSKSRPQLSLGTAGDGGCNG